MLFAILLSFGCSQPPIPQVVVDEIATSLAGLGHPSAEFQSGLIVNSARGTFGNGTHDRYVDVAIVYARKARKDPDPHTMTVRLYLESIEPCRVSVDVLSDDGPKPRLLDNGAVSALVGGKLCAAMYR